MNVTVIGGGNVGTQLAVHCAAAGNNVTVYSSKPQLFGKHLTISNKSGRPLLSADICRATADISEAVDNADMIIVTLPAFCMDDIAAKLLSYIRTGLIILLVPGTGGSEFAFRECRRKGAVICGLQRVPSVARLVEYGKEVCAEGYRDCLYLAALPKEQTDKLCTIVSTFMSMECKPLPDYLNLTLTPSNPILHTSRLRTIFKDYKEGRGYNSLPLFYEEWSDESSELLFEMDNEVQQLCALLDGFDLSYVKSLKIHYGCDLPSKLTAKIRSISGFKGLKTPFKVIDGMLYPDLESRYFTADFPYGLAVIICIAELYGANIPKLRSVMEWYRSVCGCSAEFKLSSYGINNKSDFEHYYDK